MSSELTELNDSQLLQEEEKPSLNYDIKKDGGKNGFYELLDPEYTDTDE